VWTFSTCLLFLVRRQTAFLPQVVLEGKTGPAQGLLEVLPAYSVATTRKDERCEMNHGMYANLNDRQVEQGLPSRTRQKGQCD
jgi:hypothetical protein